MMGMKRIILFYVLASSTIGFAENPKGSYSDDLWAQYTKYERAIDSMMKKAEKDMYQLESIDSSPQPNQGIVANWAKQRTGKSKLEFKEDQERIQKLGKLMLDCRSEVHSQQERMRTVQFVQTQTNEISPFDLEESMRRLTTQIERLVKMENTLMGKMGLVVLVKSEEKENRVDPLALLPGCPLCQLAGSPNGLPGHTNSNQTAILPDPNTFDSGLNP
jgi:hypothetical protein